MEYPNGVKFYVSEFYQDLILDENDNELTDEEYNLYEEWLHQHDINLENGHFDCDFDELMNPVHTVCEITGQLTNCVIVHWVETSNF